MPDPTTVSGIISDCGTASAAGSASGGSLGKSLQGFPDLALVSANLFQSNGIFDARWAE